MALSITKEFLEVEEVTSGVLQKADKTKLQELIDKLGLNLPPNNGSEDVKNFAERFVDVWIKLPGLAPNNNPEERGRNLVRVKAAFGAALQFELAKMLKVQCHDLDKSSPTCGEVIEEANRLGANIELKLRAMQTIEAPNTEKNPGKCDSCGKEGDLAKRCNLEKGNTDKTGPKLDKKESGWERLSLNEHLMLLEQLQRCTELQVKELINKKLEQTITIFEPIIFTAIENHLDSCYILMGCQQLEEIPLKVFTTSFPASGSTLRKYTKNRWVPSGKSAANPAVNRNDENVKRGNWSSKTDYLLSMIGCAVGLGNVWRFPFLAYKNGGGVFLIPYSIMLGLVGIPIFFLESSFGQFASLGPVAVWKSVPMLQGVGVTMVLLIIIANISYACIIGYSLYYLFASFQSPLDMLLSVIGCIFMKWEPSLLIEQYWDQAVLHRTSSLDETGEIVWHLALCLLLAWLMVGAAFLKGIKSSGKVVYFTAIIPYVVVTILLIRGVTLEGASKGIEFYIGSHSDFSKLADAQVWKDAATQIFYSTSVGWGSLITLSSYNKFHNNCYQDTIIVCVVNCATSVFAGFIIFSTLGHMAHVQNKPVSEVARSGFGLAFIAYPEALAQLPWATLWSILFFFMLLTLGLDTLFASFETVITSLLDQFPEFLRPKRLYLTAGLCLLFYFLGLLFVTQEMEATPVIVMEEEALSR
ncbi:sodium- and chloride-dependent neutral and basic amino acid transporter B(0+)-like [Hemiscyllium ocellatum]|uniref:sodium- and chloride-dependent neutral and basic amino acid transporter B(0+)-like n=1 Tax=Hemiscyllium ocellatum TaxID=170820 RepID=UPI002966950A|nr:sodium- and chloride-dependent neutral and basic amino acid transporter B(0+)-like [Hemiscyllium ocellatum]